MTRILQDKVILVTGAGSGIGAAAAGVFARHGARLLLADITADRVQPTADLIRDRGGQAVTIGCNITSESDVQAMVAMAIDHFGRLDGAFNNAGIANAELATTADMPRAVFGGVIDINLAGTFLCMKYELAAMGAGGAIVNNASNAGKAAVPLMACYGASKAGIISMTQTAAVEFATNNIRVNAVCPGLIMTDTIRAVMDSGVDLRGTNQIPMDRGGEPEEVGELAAWLLSPLASYVTGQAISIDGGQSAMQ